MINNQNARLVIYQRTKMRNWLFIKEPKCEIGYLLNNQNAKLVITGAQPKAGTGLKMQTVRFFNVTLLGIYR